jgi:hypothetical protein
LREGEGGKKRRGRVQRSGGCKLTVMGQSSNNYLSFYLTAEIHDSSSHLRALGRFGETDTLSLNFKQPDSDRPHCSITATKNSPVVVEIMHELDLLALLANLTEAIQRSESSRMT